MTACFSEDTASAAAIPAVKRRLKRAFVASLRHKPLLSAKDGIGAARLVSVPCKPSRRIEMHRMGNQQHRGGHPVRRPAWLSYPHIAATLALFFALTGTAAAAVTLARDSVGAEH